MPAAAVARIIALEQAIESLGEAVQISRAHIARLNAPLDLAVSQLLRAGAAVASVARNVNEFLLPPLQFATRQIGSLAAGTAAYGAEISRAARLTAIGVERYQELRYAAGQAGVAHESLTQALVDLNQAARSASSGNAELIDRFAALGVSAEELRSLAPDQLFLRVIDGLRQLDDPALQTEIGAALFGGVAPRLKRLLEGGSAGIEQSAQQARDLGNVLGADAIAEANAFKTQLDLLNNTFNGLAVTIGSQLLPVLEPLIDKLTLWISANRDLIATKIEEVVGKIVDAILEIDFDTLFDSIVRVVDGIGALIEGLGGWEVAALTLAGLLSGDKGFAKLAVIGGGLSAFWQRVKGEPNALEAAMESVTELLEELQENRKKYATASPTERKILDREFRNIASKIHAGFEVIDVETAKIPRTIIGQPRGGHDITVPNPERLKLDRDTQALKREFSKWQSQQEAEPQETPQPAPTRPSSNEPASNIGSAGTQQLKGALDVYVHVEGTPTKVSVVQRPGSTLDLSAIYRGQSMVEGLA